MKLTILQGDVFERMAQLPDASIDLCITSPPYWGLRSYGAGPQELGNEPTMEAYLENTLRWVQEVWRVLKPSGNFVLNMGDCFIGGGRGSAETREKGKQKGEGFAGGQRGGNLPDWKALKGAGTRDWKANSTPTAVNVEGLWKRTNGNCSKMRKDSVKGCNYYKPKQLLSVSSFAYCRIVSETDFVCRGEHIWAKPNVPSPIRSRLKHSHEKLFWFVKDADKYYFDSKAWMKKVQGTSIKRIEGSFEVDSPHCDNIGSSPSSCFRKGNATACLAKSLETIEHSWRIVPVGAKQNGFELAGKRPSEHVAPYPEELIRPYIKGMAPSGGIVLDPVLGSGTTMRVAMEEGRDCIGIELNPKSVAYAKKRCNFGAGLAEYSEEPAGSSASRAEEQDKEAI